MNASLLAFAALVIFALAMGLWIRGIRRVSLPSNRGLFILAWIVAFALSLQAQFGDPTVLARIVAGLTTAASAFVVFTISISTQKVGSQALKVGDLIPSFTALDDSGESFDSAVLAGKPVLLKFFRGHW